MIARVVVVDKSHIDFSNILGILRKSHNQVRRAKSPDETIKIIGSHGADLVMVGLPKVITKDFLDFCAMLRQLCNTVPIIGVINKSSDTDLSIFLQIGLDDVVYANVTAGCLKIRIDILNRMKSKFDDSLASNAIVPQKDKKIAAIFYDDVNFLHDNILQNTKISVYKKYHTADLIDDVDLFMINSDHKNAHKLSATLNGIRQNKHKPIIFTYDLSTKQKAIAALKMKVGCTDIVDIKYDKNIVACRLYSFIKYKQMYELFISKLKKCVRLAALDSCTGIYNRSFFEDYVSSKPVIANTAVLMIDIDDFKLINDKHGHSFADAALKYICDLIKTCVRSSDIIARYGGDEIVLLLSNIVNLEEVSEIASRIQKKIENNPYNGVINTVSIGGCYHYDNINEAVNVADKFMYIAKQTGKNSIKICA